MATKTVTAKRKTATRDGSGSLGTTLADTEKHRTTNGKAQLRSCAGTKLTKQRMLAKLKESGLDENDAKLLGLKPCTATQAAELKLPFAEEGFSKFRTTSQIERSVKDMFRYRNFDAVRETNHTSGFLKTLPKRRRYRSTFNRKTVSRESTSLAI